MKILIADDEALARERIVELLRDIPDCTLTGQAVNGRDAVEQAITLQADVVIMDIAMPVMDGLEAIRQIRQSSEPRLREVPIICLSGLAVAGDMEKCLAAGATSYLAKPFGVQQLQRAIRSFLPLP